MNLMRMINMIKITFTHSEPVAAAVAARVRAARIEVQVVCAVRDRRVLRGRPVVAVRAGIAEAGVIAAARCWQEDATTVGLTSELATLYSILRRPFVGAIFSQFILLFT